MLIFRSQDGPHQTGFGKYTLEAYFLDLGIMVEYKILHNDDGQTVLGIYNTRWVTDMDILRQASRLGSLVDRDGVPSEVLDHVIDFFRHDRCKG